MKRLVLFSGLFLFVLVSLNAQNVFNAADPIVRYDSTQPLGSPQRPNPATTGLQKWVSVPTNSITTGYGAWDASSYKAYYINVRSGRLPFRLKFPKSYSNPDSINKKYPIMLFFHGAGEPGCPVNGGIYNNEKQLLHGGQLFSNRVNNDEFDGFLLYPQVLTTNCSSTWPSSNDAQVIATIDSLAKYARADIDRLFVDGLSDGGRNTWRFTRAYPQRVAMIAPSAMYAGTTSHGAMIHIPVWFATGGKDSNPSPAQAQQTLTTFLNLGGNIRYTLYPELGHSVWNAHWGEPDFVKFMNSMHKANPLVFFQHNDWCAGQTIAARMGLTSGFAQYEWQKDGVTIARRANNTNTILVAAAVTSFTGNEITVKQYGTYRARFRRTATGLWSEWSPTPVVVGVKEITNPLPIAVNGIRSSVLPALDGSTTVPLVLANGFSNYRWYTSTGTTALSTVQFYNAPVGIYRGRYDETFGCGSNYSPNFSVVNANGNPKPAAATQLNGLPVAQTVVALTWLDQPAPPSNETAFEVYRGTASGGPYQLVKILPAETTTYNDSNLTANTSYYYVVRAINNTGASPASNEATVKTLIDNKPPSSPLNFAYGGSSPNSVTLRWQPSTDDIGIKRYDIYIGNIKHYSTASTTFTANNLDPNKWYAFTVRAVDVSGNLSAPSPQVMGYTHPQGLNYKYYEGTFSALPDFNALTPVKTGIASDVNAGSSFRNNEDNYAIKWEGYIYIPSTAYYQFGTISDEGSKVYIDVDYDVSAPELVNNDGIHPPVLATSAPISLAKGYHKIVITYFERSSIESMNIAWGNNAGITGEIIPARYFTPTLIDGNPPVVAPSGLTATTLSYNKIRLNWTDVSDDETGFEILRSATSGGGFVPAGRVGANKTTFTDSDLSSATTYYYKVRGVGTLSESPYTPEAFETTLPAPGTPVAPTALTSEGSTTTRISLGWIDNANNETEIQVWRSEDGGVNFAPIGALQPNSNSFTDNNVTPFAQYYYYVVGANGNGNGASSDTLGVIAGNNAPVLSTINNMFVKTDASLLQNFTVTDAGDVINISIDNKPSFITLQHVSGNNYRITLNPTTDNIGWHNLTLKATDSKGAIVTQNFVVSVADKNTRSVYLKFGPAGKAAPAPWTNWPGTRAANNVISNLRDENNVVTPYSVTTVNAWSGTSNLGHLSGNNGGVVPDSVLQGGLIDNGVAKTIRIGGLNPALRYNLVFVGSQNEGLNAQTRFAVGTIVDTLNARYNTNVTANLNNVVPTGGQVTVTITRIGGSLVTYLNALIIEEYLPAITVLNPLNLYAEAVDRTRINLTWSDRSSNESAANGYELTRATDSLFTLNVVTVNLLANTTAYQSTGLAPNTGYWFRVRARSGATLSDYSNRAKAFTPSSTVFINFNANVANAPFPWNNTIAQPTSPTTFPNLINQAGNNSGLNMRIEQIFNGEFNAGMSTGNNSGVVPDVALQANYWQDKTQISQFRLSGLNQTRKYRIGFFGSSGPNGWVKGNYTGKYTINGRTVYLNAWSNTTRISYIDNVVPDDNGEALLTFSTTAEAAYGFHGGVTIDDYSDGSASQVLSDNQVLDSLSENSNYGLKNRMYPNPFGDDITVDYNNVSGTGKVSAMIYDVTGRLVYRQEFKNLNGGYNQLRLKTGSLRAGSKTFMVIISSNGKILMSNKMIKK